MVGDNKIDTQLDLRSHVEDNSIGLVFAIILTVLLFLRNAKKIRLLEREAVIILRLLRKRNDLNPDSQC